jgi:hypothetical protein
MNAIAEFRQPPSFIPPEASPLLSSILLAIALCERAEQLAAWWDWPAHRKARWRLSPEESAQAADAMDRRRCEFSAAT